MDQNQWNTNPENAEQNTSEQKNDFYTQPDPTYNFTPPQKAATNGYAIASLILGIVSIVLCSCSCITIVTAILAIVFAALSRGGKPMDAKALAGMICGIVALVIIVVSIVAMVAFIAETNTEDLMEFYGDFENFSGEYPFEDFYYDPSFPEGIPEATPAP
ncbi:MAG: DUF4190 domain-containing protein [Clostridia bacterium]|nr:DUF4190 domain-containing protein [Clostridia bacterium]